MQIEERPPQTQYIGQRGGRTLFHGVRLARSLNIEPNLFVTINFWETSLTIYEMAPAFLEMRRKYARWSQNPSQPFAGHSVPPTFLWVLENPEDQGFFHAHWGKPNIAVTRGNLSARLLVVSEQELSSNRLRAESRRIDGQPGI